MTNLDPENPGYLVTWAEDLGLENVYAREVMPNGSMSDIMEITSAGGWVSVAGGGMNYMVAVEGIGIDVRIVGNTKPKASFTITPTEADSDTLFNFNASATTDVTDDPEVLEFRWDWENNGSFDTSWSHNRNAVHQYTLPEWQCIATFTPRLQVRDDDNGYDWTTREVTVRNVLCPQENMDIYLPLIMK